MNEELNRSKWDAQAMKGYTTGKKISASTTQSALLERLLDALEEGDVNFISGFIVALQEHLYEEL